MVGKNNKFLKENKNNQRFLRFSLRKLSVGVVSVAIAAGFYIGGSQSVLADTPSTAPNYDSIVTTDENTVNQQSASTSADSSSVAGAADSTAAEAGKSTAPAASSAAEAGKSAASAVEQQKMAMFNVAKEKSAATSNTANLLGKKVKVRSYAASDTAKAEEDQLADKLLKNSKISDPTDSNFARYQGYVDKYNNQTTDTSSQYVFSVIRDYYGYDFIWTIDRDTGSKVFVYLAANYGRGYEEIKGYALPSDGGNFPVGKDGNIILNYTPKTDSESGSINVTDQDGNHLTAVYGLGAQVKSSSSYGSIAELLPEKGQPIIKFLYKDPNSDGKLVNLRKPIYCKEGLTGQSFVLDTSNYANDISDYTKNDKAFDGFTLEPNKNNDDNKIFEGTFTQFDQGKTYVKYYTSDDSEVIYQQLDASGTMKVDYYKDVHSDEGPRFVGSIDRLEAGKSQKIIDDATGGTMTVRNPFVSGSYSYEFIYTPDPQTGKIIYQDANNNNVEVDHTDLKGKTTQDIDVKGQINVPTNWKIVPGQKIPDTVKATADGIPTVKVNIKHDTITVNPGDPKKPSDKLPDGTNYPAGVDQNDLNHDVVRTINITKPDKTTTTTTQKTSFNRTATIDLVDHSIKYGNWVQQGDNGWKKVDVPVVAGYTPSVQNIDKVAVTPDTEDATIDVTYTANDQSMNINYVDDQGNVIANFSVSGKTDQTVETKAKIPAGWVLVKGQQEAPATITFTGAHTDDITIKIEHGKTSVDHNDPVNPGAKTPSGKEIKGAHDEDLNKTITRTINVTTPDGQTTTTKQVAKIYRDATIDNVTGEVTYSDWSEGTWADYKPGQVAGYTASQADVPAVTVKDGQNDQTVNISYTANDQSMNINYVDDQGNVIANFSVSGKTDQTVETKAKIPAGWVLVKGQQEAPATITFTGAHTDDITIKIEHGKTSVDHNDPVNPGAKTPSGKEIKGAHDEDLNKTITRTINVTTPDGQTTTTKQVAKIYRDATIDNVTGEVTYSDWSEGTWADYKPGQVAGYTASQADVPAVTVKDGQNDQTVNISYTANDQSMNINYVDDQGNVIANFSVSGKTDQTVETKAKIPAGWVLVKGQQEAPATITFTGAHTDDITIKIEHGKTSVDHNDPVNPGAKTPSGKEIKGAHDEDLNKTITRTINVTTPDGQTTTTKQVAKIYRDATIDNVTGEVTYSDWSEGTWADYKPGQVAGYTASQADVPAVTVKDGQNDQTVNISYTANDQSMNINYVDDQGNVIANFSVSGKTDQTVETKAKIPAGWVLVKGQQEAPATITFTGAHTDDITIKIEHGKTSVDHNDPVNPGAKTPSGKEIKGAHDEDLNKTITRTINVTTPDGQTTTTKQVAKIYRDATIDNVTGEVTYSDWSEGTWADYKPGQVAGYTASQADVPAVTVKDGQNDQTVNISYTANDQSMNINYVDDQGNVIANFSVSGKTDQTVETKAKIPAGWVLVKGQQEAPATITFTGAHTDDITIKIEHGKTSVDHNDPVNPGAKTPSGKEIKGAHDEDLNKTITRTINVTTPDGQTTTTKQVAKIYRDATIDNVTGEVTYSDWSEGTWADYKPGQVAGYTASQADVPAVTVKDGQNDQTVNISYTANDQSMNINYVDDQGNVIANFSVSGKTDQTVETKAKIPAGWVLVKGQQEAPATITFTGAHTDDITIKIEHGKTSVDHNDPVNPGAKTPSGKEIKGAHDEDLNKTITRTINVTTPDGQTTTTKQVAKIYRDATIDNVTGEVTYSDWSEGTWADYKPGQVAGYTASQADVPAVTVKDGQNDQTVNISYTANDQSMNINYVDDQGNVIANFSVSGKTDQTVETKAKIPAGWVLVKGQQEAPATITFTGAHTDDITIKIEHGKTSVDHNDPVNPGAKTPSGKEIKGAHDEDLNKTITRTINVTTPDGQTTTTKQVAKIYRDATIDNVTGEVTYSDWSEGTWADYKPGQVAGYTASQADVPAVTVKDGQNDQTVNISYTANDQSMNINYVDDQGNVIANFSVSGKTDQTVETKAKIPAGWVLVKGQQEAPATITFTGAHTDDITIKIEHGKTSVDHNDPVNPGAKTPSGKEIKGAHDEDLNKTITRTINVTTPDGQTTTTKQVAKIYRDATIDNVTGEVTYSDWSEGTWADYKPGQVAGYTASQADVPAVTVKDGQNDQTVNISYTANDQSMNINYVDDQGNVIANFSVSGKTDQTVETKAKIPAGWVLVKGQQEAPATITFTGAHTDDITIKIEHGKTSVDHNDPVNPGAKTPSGKEIKGAHDEDLNKTITRTINVTTPDGQTTTTKQVAKIYRDATIDNVTGEVTYSDWSEGTWADYKPGQVAGYTASQADVPAVTVKDGQNDQTVNISYTANDQSMNINYVDDQGNVIANFSVSGKTDQTVETKAKIPAGWVLVKGQQEAPATITFTGAHTDDITIKIEHGKTSVDHNDPVNPGAKTPSGKEIKGAHDEDLNKTITRTINVTTPDGQTTTTKQVAKIYRDATIDNVTGEVTYSDWSEGTWADYKPGQVAGYTASQADVPAVTVKDGQNDQTVNISYTANDQSMNINYVDDQGNVIANFSVSGKTDQTVETKAKIPAGWVLVKGQQEAPATITFTGAHTDDITIKIEHGKTSVDHNDPVNPGAKTPSGKEIKGAHDEDLNKTITRTINVTTPDGQTTTTKQVAKIYRDATIDNVTGEVTYSDWSEGTWADYKPGQVAGYTASQADVPAVTVKDGQNDQTVNISYTANDQSMNINYVDDQGNVIANFSVSGKTDQTVETKAKIPAGWVLVKGQQEAPATITFTGAHTDDITIKIEHGKTSVDHNDPVNPGAKTPSGKEIKGAHDEDLNKTITRTINVTTPDGQTTTTKQVAKIYRDATIDNVTGEVTYSDWSEGTWADYKPGQVAGYTASQADVPAVTVKDGQNDQTVNISYTANEGTVLIKYVDRDGNEIGQQVITGHVGDTIKVTPQFPENWVPVDPDTVPAEVQIKEENGQIIIVVVRHDEKDPVQTKKVTRTIMVTTPDGQTKTIKQVVTISRHGNLDLVTGQIAWQPWTTAQWDVFKPAAIAGYIPSLAEVPAVTVDGETTDQTVDITYATVATPAQPEHQAPTASDTPDAQQATNQKADSNAQPAVTVVTSQQTATAQQAESTTNSRRLPQTGNSHDASALAGLGLASLMGLLGLGGKRRKRD